MQGRASTQRFDTLIVGLLTDAASVGFYRVAKRIGAAALRLGSSLQQAIHPDIARLWVRGEAARFRRLVLRVNVGVAAVACIGVDVVSLRLEESTVLPLGPDFAPAAPMTLVQAVAVAALPSGSTFNAAVYSLGHDRLLARITLAAAGFFVALFLPTHGFGAISASFAHLRLSLALVAGSFALFLRGAARGAAPVSAAPAVPSPQAADAPL